MPLHRRLMAWAVMRKTQDLSSGERRLMQGLCDVLKQLLGKPYQRHMADLLIDAASHADMVTADFALLVRMDEYMDTVRAFIGSHAARSKQASLVSRRILLQKQERERHDRPPRDGQHAERGSWSATHECDRELPS